MSLQKLSNRVFKVFTGGEFTILYSSSFQSLITLIAKNLILVYKKNTRLEQFILCPLVKVTGEYWVGHEIIDTELWYHLENNDMIMMADSVP